MLVLCAVLEVFAPAAHGQGTPQEPLPPNPFSAFESFRLPNGLKVWYGHMPGSTVTTMALVVPAGRDDDPPGREQAAHLLEHVLLSDRHGAAEADLARELTRRGGAHSAYTGATYTHFLVNIGSDEAAFGLRWLHDVVAPRTFGADLVERNRQPVAVELGARGGMRLPPLVHAYLRHPRLRPAGFWRREFALDAQEERGADQLAGLAAITPADVRAFYDTHYTPAQMTLVVVSGRSRPALQPVLDSTFALLPWRPGPERAPRLAPRAAESRSVRWHVAGGTRLSLRYRISGLSGRDDLRLAFVEDLLHHRLMERLRRGESKVVYGIATATVTRGSAAFFAIDADLAPPHEGAVRHAIETEIGRIARAVEDTVAFYADRDALARRLRIENASPAALRHWATDRFSGGGLHESFPDLGGYYATVGPDSIAALAGRLFVPENRISHVARPVPLPVWVLALLALTVAAGAVRLYRRATLRPARMGAVRFIARLRAPWPARLLHGGMLALAALLAGRVAFAALHIASSHWAAGLDSFVPLAAAGAALVFILTFGGLAAVGAFHRKVLVFDDEVRLKSATYRATIIPAALIRGVRPAASPAGLRLRRPVPPPAGAGVFLELVDGSGHYLRTARQAELLEAVRRLIPPPPHAAGPPPAACTAATEPIGQAQA